MQRIRKSGSGAFLALLPTLPAHAGIIILLLLASPLCAAATTSFELDLQDLDRVKPAPSPQKVRKLPPKPAPKRHDIVTRSSSGHVKYTVKPGDHLFRILMKQFGLSNDSAERLIPEVARLNGISDIRQLSVGQVLLLPSRTGTKHPHEQRKLRQRGDSPQTAAGSTVTARAATAPPELEPDPEPAAYAAETAVPPAAEADPVPVKTEKIPSTTREELIDGILAALAIETRENEVLEANIGGNPLSVKVDRFFIERGRRFIVNCTPKDQFNYTLLRLLERDGYTLIDVEGSGFNKVTEKLLSQLGRTYRSVEGEADGESAEAAGFLVENGAGQVFLTDASK
ncbi:LysM peptidoglycan-binding domain-containing protein [Geobacter sp. DSM 9736]|uniref:LysM peptidoglycan-binding domain-containing protein n=1 Tax=Geobacter sp. DSM 9736 TaxID=1277350 RepID=UPI000B50B8DA|nr:LysM peptidoglycan-binding domain-containing protein [Geobacter sp. DSM 9736]SNB47550.1 LysM domain-containing protein [Geobacter sp. DSM 9736]